ncbi:hypothetical protein TWF696_002040 [Orbilia brochopaga]|uniref:Uncharacterized protein n=1 Tax=Orbilia brochopaga TaxID=3140254 RepID=A0AAV9UAX7_9PEZI
MTMVMTSTARVVKQPQPTSTVAAPKPDVWSIAGGGSIFNDTSTPTNTTVDTPTDSPTPNSSRSSSPSLSDSDSTLSGDTLLSDYDDGWALMPARTDPEAEIPSGSSNAPKATKTSGFLGPDYYFRYFEAPSPPAPKTNVKDESEDKFLQDMLTKQEKYMGGDVNAKHPVKNSYIYTWTGALTFNQKQDKGKGKAEPKPDKGKGKAVNKRSSRRPHARSTGRTGTAGTKAKVKRAAIRRKQNRVKRQVIAKRGLFSKFKSIAKSVFNKVKDVVIGNAGKVVEKVQQAKAVISTIKDQAGGLRNTIDKSVLAGIDIVKDAAKNDIDRVKTAVIEKLQSAKDKAQDMLRSGVEATIGKVSDGLATVKDGIGQVKETIDTAIKDGAQNIKDKLQIDKIANGVKDLINNGCEEDEKNPQSKRGICVKDLGKAAARKLKGKVKTVVEHVPGIIKEGVKTLTSDNQAINDLANNVQNTANKIKDGAGTAIKNIEKAGTAIEKAYQAGIDKISKAEDKVGEFKGKVDSVIDTINVAVQDNLDKAKGTIEGVVEKGVMKAKGTVDRLADRIKKTDGDVANIDDAEGIVEDVIADAADGDSRFLGEEDDSFKYRWSDGDDSTDSGSGNSTYSDSDDGDLLEDGREDAYDNFYSGTMPDDNSDDGYLTDTDAPGERKDPIKYDCLAPKNDSKGVEIAKCECNTGDCGVSDNINHPTPKFQWTLNGQVVYWPVASKRPSYFLGEIVHGDTELCLTFVVADNEVLIPPYDNGNQPGKIGNVELRECAGPTNKVEERHAQIWAVWIQNDGYPYTR